MLKSNDSSDCRTYFKSEGTFKSKLIAFRITWLYGLAKLIRALWTRISLGFDSEELGFLSEATKIFHALELNHNSNLYS